MAKNKYGSKYRGLKLIVKRHYTKDIDGEVIKDPGIAIQFINGVFDVEQFLDNLENNDRLIKNSREVTKKDIIRTIEADPEYRAKRVWEIRIMTKEEQEAMVKDQVLKAISRLDENGRFKLLNDLTPNKPGLSYTNITNEIRVPQESQAVVAKEVTDEPVATKRGRPAKVN